MVSRPLKHFHSFKKGKNVYKEFYKTLPTYLIFVISFTQAGFSKTKFYTQKKRLKAPKTLKMSLKKSNICIFFTQSGKNYTWQKFFTQAPPVVPLTNMRYGEDQRVWLLCPLFLSSLSSISSSISSISVSVAKYRRPRYPKPNPK